MTLLHKHHKIPKHAGGSNDSSNIEVLTIPEHAEAHRLLWEAHNKFEDFVAWKALSGQITFFEARRLSSFSGKPHSKETKLKMSQLATGRTRSVESRVKQSMTISGSNNHFYGKTHSDDFKQMMSVKQKARYTGAGSNTAIAVEVEDDTGVHRFGCIKDYAVWKGIKPIKVQGLFRELQRSSEYRPKDGDPTSCIISMKRMAF